jgi:hypothetical protein
LDVRDLTVTMTSPTQATVIGATVLVMKTSRTRCRAGYKPEKRDGRWLIVETNPK